MSLGRKGRPPKVRIDDDGTATVVVKGTEFKFKGNRASNQGHEDFGYARAVVERELSKAGLS